MSSDSATSSVTDNQPPIADLLRAAADGDLPTVRRLVESDRSLVGRAGPHPYWGGQPQAIQVAAEWGRLDIVRHLLDAGANPDGAVESYGGWSALHCALNRGHGSGDFDGVIRLLMDRGATVDIWAAARLGDRMRVTTLLDEQPDRLLARGPNDATPLHFAGNVETAQLLLARGAAPQARDCYGRTPLEAAIGTAERNAVARYLIDATGECNLALACAVGLVARVQSELDSDPKLVHCRVKYDQARRSGFCDGDSLLHIAVASGQLPVVQLLIERTADVNAQSADGRTPLHVAARHGHREIAAALLDHGADPNAIDSEHRATPLDWARFHGHYGVAAVLRRHSAGTPSGTERA